MAILGAGKTRSRTLKDNMDLRAAHRARPVVDPERTNTLQEFSMSGAELEKVHVEIAKLMAETTKLNAEAGKMTRETFWYPVAVATGLIGTVATVTTLLIKFV
jgi:hypothetical protein